MFRYLLERLSSFADGIKSVFSAIFWWFEGVSEVPRQIGRGLLRIFSGIFWVIKSPKLLFEWVVDFARGIVSGGKYVAKSVEATGRSITDTAASMKETVEQQPSFWQRLFSSGITSFRTWYWNQALWYRVVFTVFLVGFIVVLATAYPAWIAIKKWRSEALISSAEKYFSEGRSYQAYLKGKAAYYMDPDNPEVLAGMIEYSRSVRAPQTMQYGQELIAQGAVSSGALKTLAEEAQRNRTPDLARAFLRRLEAVDPDNEAIVRLRIELLILEGKKTEAYDMAKEVFNEESSAEILGHYASLALESETGEKREELISMLRLETARKDKRGLYAGLLLLKNGGLNSVEDVEEVTSLVLENPEVSRGHKLIAYSARIETGMNSIKELRPELDDLFDLGLQADRVQYAMWLFNSSHYEEIIRIFDKKDIANDSTLFSIYALAMIETNAKDRALDLLRSSEAFVLSEIERLILEAQAQRSLGRDEAYVSTVERAIARADINDFKTLEGYLKRLKSRDFLIKLYEKFVTFPTTAAECDANRLLFAYEERDVEEIDQIIQRQRLAAMKDFPASMSLLAYLRGLRKVGLLENIREMETLVAKYPGVIDFRVSLALNYFQQGYIGESGEVLQGVVDKSLQSVTGMNAVFNAVKWAANSHFGQADSGLNKYLDEPMLDIEREFLLSILGLEGN
jgi:hypothetical protein